MSIAKKVSELLEDNHGLMRELREAKQEIAALRAQVAGLTGALRHIERMGKQEINVYDSFPRRIAKYAREALDGELDEHFAALTAAPPPAAGGRVALGADALDAELIDAYTLGEPTGNTCPECGVILRHSEGCETCPQCGWTKC